MLSPISGLMAFFISVLQLPNVLRNLADRSKNDGFITYGAFFFLFSMVLGSSLVLMRQIRIYCTRPAVIPWSFIGGLILQFMASENYKCNRKLWCQTTSLLNLHLCRLLRPIRPMLCRWIAIQGFFRKSITWLQSIWLDILQHQNLWFLIVLNPSMILGK